MIKRLCESASLNPRIRKTESNSKVGLKILRNQTELKFHNKLALYTEPEK